MGIKAEKKSRLKNLYFSYNSLSHFEKIQLRISYFLKLIVFITIVISIFEMNLFLMTSSIIVLIFSALPALIERKFRIILPVEIDLAFTTFIFLHFILGEGADYYNRFWWYDLMLHFSSGILIGMVGFMIIYFILYASKMKVNPLVVVIFSISFSLAAGAIWEIIEFLLDLTLGFNMQKSGLVDTMTDLIDALIGACIVGIGVYRYLKKNEDGPIKALVNKFILFNVRRKEMKLRKKNIQTEAEKQTNDL